MKWKIPDEKRSDFCITGGFVKRKPVFFASIGGFAKKRDFRINGGFSKRKCMIFWLNGKFAIRKLVIFT